MACKKSRRRQARRSKVARKKSRRLHKRRSKVAYKKSRRRSKRRSKVAYKKSRRRSKRRSKVAYKKSRRGSKRRSNVAYKKSRRRYKRLRKSRQKKQLGKSRKKKRGRKQKLASKRKSRKQRRRRLRYRQSLRKKLKAPKITRTNFEEFKSRGRVTHGKQTLSNNWSLVLKPALGNREQLEECERLISSRINRQFVTNRTGATHVAALYTDMGILASSGIISFEGNSVAAQISAFSTGQRYLRQRLGSLLVAFILKHTRGPVLLNAANNESVISFWSKLGFMKFAANKGKCHSTVRMFYTGKEKARARMFNKILKKCRFKRAIRVRFNFNCIHQAERFFYNYN